MPILKNAANVEVKDMFISVNRCEVGQNPEKTTIMEVMEDFGINVQLSLPCKIFTQNT